MRFSQLGTGQEISISLSEVPARCVRVPARCVQVPARCEPHCFHVLEAETRQTSDSDSQPLHGERLQTQTGLGFLVPACHYTQFVQTYNSELFSVSMTPIKNQTLDVSVHNAFGCVRFCTFTLNSLNVLTWVNRRKFPQNSTRFVSAYMRVTDQRQFEWMKIIYGPRETEWSPGDV